MTQTALVQGTDNPRREPLIWNAQAVARGRATRGMPASRQRKRATEVTGSPYVQALMLMTWRVAVVITVSISLLTLSVTNLILLALDLSAFLGPYLAAGFVIVSTGLLATALSAAGVIRSEISRNR